jgi:hypothetical protein
MTRARVFLVYADPGHAWVKVPKSFLPRVGGDQWRRHFTAFSYESTHHVFLEEDRDAARFIELCKQEGITPVLKEGSTCANRQSRIRSYRTLAP